MRNELAQVRNVYHGLIACVAIPDNEFAIKRARYGMPAIAGEVDTCNFVDVAFENFPTLGLTLWDGWTRSKICRVSDFFLLLPNFFRQGGKFLLQGLGFCVYFRHLLLSPIKVASGLKYEALWNGSPTDHCHVATVRLQSNFLQLIFSFLMDDLSGRDKRPLKSLEAKKARKCVAALISLPLSFSPLLG